MRHQAEFSASEFMFALIMCGVFGISSVAFVSQAVSTLDNRFFVPVYFSLVTVILQLQGLVYFGELATLYVYCNIVIISTWRCDMSSSNNSLEFLMPFFDI